MTAPPTVLELVRAAARRLRRAGVVFGHGTTNARDEAVWLVLHALGLAPDHLQAVAAHAVSALQRAAVDRLVEARIRTRKPAAYLTHEAWLGEHRFYVDDRVIVPRSFIAEVLRDERLRGLPDLMHVRRALDLCAGSGCLAILTALTHPWATVDAADLSPAALAVARRNITDYGLRGRIRCVRSDLFGALRSRRYDLIVANPPYVTGPAMARLPAEYRREPALALAGGRDGLDFVRRIVKEAPAHLTEHGVLVLEVGHARTRVERTFPRLRARWADTSGGRDCVLIATRAALIRAAAAVLPRADARARPASPAVRTPLPARVRLSGHA